MSMRIVVRYVKMHMTRALMDRNTQVSQKISRNHQIGEMIGLEMYEYIIPLGTNIYIYI
jgi:hypothetical protein